METVIIPSHSLLWGNYVEYRVLNGSNGQILGGEVSKGVQPRCAEGKQYRNNSDVLKEMH